MRKVSDNLKKHWRNMRILNKQKYVISHIKLSEKLDHSQIISIKHIKYSKIIENEGIEIQGIIDALSDEGAERLERELALWLFRAWLAAPDDSEFHLKALRSFLRSYAEKLELAGRGLPARDAAISVTAATLSPRNSSFYNGIYAEAGGPDVVHKAEISERLASDLADAAKWMFEIIIMLSAFHAIHEKIGSEKYRGRASLEKGYKLVMQIPWAPDILIFRKNCTNDIMGRRKEKTIKDNIRKSGWDVACIAYASYSFNLQSGENFLETLMKDPRSDKITADMVLHVLKMARYAFEQLVPSAVNVEKNILPVDVIAFPPPQGFEGSLSIAEEIFKPSRGRGHN